MLAAAAAAAAYRQFETPEEIAHREQQIDARFNELTELHTRKKDVLDDDLAREEFKASVRFVAVWIQLLLYRLKTASLCTNEPRFCGTIGRSSMVKHSFKRILFI